MCLLSDLYTLFLAALKRAVAFWGAFHKPTQRELPQMHLPGQMIEPFTEVQASFNPNPEASNLQARFRLGPYANGPP